MSVNLAKYKESLLSAWKDVLDDKSPTDWALFGYEGQTNDLKVVSKGTGGIEELVDDLNSGKIMYAFCKIIDPKTSLPKCVLINWQGEGAPIVRKGTCANHVRDVGNFFKGAHVTLHARNEEEVDPQLVVDKVAKSGSAYSFNQRVESETGAGPVGTTYKKVMPRQEIDSKERDKFWEKEEQEEKQRQVEERQKRSEESSKLDQERKQRELNEAAAREAKIQVRTKNIFEQREAEKQSQVVKVEESNVEAGTGDEERKGRSDVLRRQRSQEAMSVISKRNFDARAIFEQNTSAGQMRNRSSLTGQQHQAQHDAPEPPASPTQHFTPTQHISPAQQVSPTHQVSPKQHVSPAQLVSPVSPSKKMPTWPPAAATESPPSKTTNGTSSPVREAPTSSPPASGNGLPPARDDDTRNGGEVAVSETQDAVYEDIEYTDDRGGQTQQNVKEPEGTAGIDVDAGYNGMEDGELGMQARALYDYQAADETELTFDPGDIISHIDQIDEGWWQGLGPDGTFGLFPANYVEVIH